ncbi:MAG: hypothetical protein HFI77_08310 [Lachnospiraceae bacterium]|jgi:hypothetical protein|nr:hypothetical protein [Lachnospiraceae bacterium]MCX4319255.1 hypothetical protein [Lachnospiraceae bacterium]
MRGKGLQLDLDKKYEKKNVLMILGGIFLAVSLLFLLALFWWNQRIVPVDVGGCEADQGQLTYKITKTYGTNFIKLEGYAYVPGQSIDYADISVIAYHPGEDKYYRLPTEIVKKTKITKKVKDGHNYDYCGFSSVVLADKIWDDTKFYIRCQNNGVDILADTGEVFDYR